MQENAYVNSDFYVDIIIIMKNLFDKFTFFLRDNFKLTNSR